MATPRRPEPPKRSGFLGFLFFIGIIGGLTWLIMFLMGWGPYGSAMPERTSTLIPPATLTATQVPSVTASHTVTPTDIPTSTPTQTLTPTDTPTPTLELRPFVLYGEQDTMPSTLIRPRLGCEWLLIAGQVWDLQHDPVTGLTLHLYGEIDGFSIDRFMLTGSAPAYGESGYEFALEELVLNSQDTLYIQLEDTNGLPLSHSYAIQTFEDCQQNLILVNFNQIR